MLQQGDAEPGLSKLGDTYDILAPLHEDGDFATYLARHRAVGRDVTITVVRVPGGAANNTMAHFASDARLLSTLRHDNIVPVLEGRWLDDDTFAVVRTVVRGSTLDQVLSAVGAFPLPRVARTVEQINDGLAWARQNGVVHRHLTSHSVCFQQGSGRVMMVLGPAPLAADGLPDACTDSRTIGALAWSMLAGRSYDAVTTDDKGLAELRPELDPAIVAETEALLSCRTGDEPRDIAGYVELLTTAGKGMAAQPLRMATTAPMPDAASIQPSESAASAISAAAPVEAQMPSTPQSDAGASGPAVAAASTARNTPPVGSEESVVVVGHRRRAGSPVAAALAIAAVILIAVFFVLHRNQRPTTSELSSGAIDTTPLGGHVSPMAAAPDTPAAMVPQPGAQPVAPPMPAPVAPAPATPGMTATPMPTSPSTTVRPGVAGQLTVTPPRSTAQDSVLQSRARDSLAANAVDPCSSPAVADQRACFRSAITRTDAELNRAYNGLIAALRRQAGAVRGDPDPDNVQELRTAQRKWVEDRDAECRRRVEAQEGTQWATSRAQCFAEIAKQRVRELSQMRDSMPKDTIP